MANTLADLKEYFGVSAKEMKDFWQSLTPEQQEYYKNAELVK